MRRRTTFSARRALLLFTLFTLLIAAAASPVRVGVVRGLSMAPTLRPRQFFLFQPWRGAEGLERGEIVVAKLNGSLVVKRLVGRPGDVLWMMGVDRERPADVRILDPHMAIGRWRARYPRMTYRRIIVPAGSLFLVGDGELSRDSRHFGPAPASSIVGRVVTAGRPNLDAVQSFWTAPHDAEFLHTMAAHPADRANPLHSH